MKYTIKFLAPFKKSYKKFKYQPEKLKIIDETIDKLAAGEVLDKKYKDHSLIGNFKGCRECHLLFDLVLVYKKQDDVLLLNCIDVGKHTEVLDRKKPLKKKF